MNILYISAYDAPRGQSARTYLFAKELVEMGHDVTFVTNGFNHFSRKEYLNKNEWYRIEYIDRIRTIWLKTYPYKTNGIDRFINMITNAIMAYIYHSKFNIQPDIVIGPSVPLFTALSAYFIAKKHKAKFIFEVRDVWPEALVLLKQINTNSLIYKLFKKLANFLYKKSDFIISALPNIDSIIFESGVSMSKVIHVPNPVIVDTYLEMKELTNKTPRIIYVGGFGTAQDIDSMLKATILLKKIDAVFEFYGVPDRIINELQDKYGNKKVFFFPVISKTKVPNILKSATVLIAAHYNDDLFKFGINTNKLHDYLSSGRPIVFAGNAPRNPVEISGAGIVVPPENPEAMANAIKSILNLSQEERIKMGKKGKRYAKINLDVKILTKKLENVFYKTLKGEE